MCMLSRVCYFLRECSNYMYLFLIHSSYSIFRQLHLKQNITRLKPYLSSVFNARNWNVFCLPLYVTSKIIYLYTIRNRYAAQKHFNWRKKRDLVATSDSKPRVFSVLMTSIAALLHYHQFQMLLKTKRKRIN
jgi:hypothetical protein